MPDERTPVLQLPLPHPDHLLSDDVLRLRDALVTVDAGFGAQRTEMQAALDAQRGQVQAALSTQQGAVSTALAEVSAAVDRRLRFCGSINCSILIFERNPDAHHSATANPDRSDPGAHQHRRPQRHPRRPGDAGQGHRSHRRPGHGDRCRRGRDAKVAASAPKSTACCSVSSRPRNRHLPNSTPSARPAPRTSPPSPWIPRRCTALPCCSNLRRSPP